MEIQLRTVKIGAEIVLRPWLWREVYFYRFLRRVAAASEARPAVGIPAQFLNAGLAAQRSGFVLLALQHEAARPLQWTVAKVHRVPLTSLSFHKTTMPGGFESGFVFLK